MKISTMLRNKTVKRILIWILWLVVWQVVFSIANKGLLIDIPTPVMTLKAILRLGGERTFWLSAVYSLLRVLFGFALSVSVGVFMGYTSYHYKLLSQLFSPILRLFRAVPVAAFIILVFLWVDNANIPWLIVFLTVLPIIWENTEKSLLGVDKSLTEMARVMGMRKKDIFSFIVYPSIKPTLTASLITGIGFAFKSGVAAEVICKCKDSLGELLWVGKTSVAYDEVFAVTVVIILLSILLEWLITSLLKAGGNND
ncbi:MAG: ABC transporter permease subunit [Acutalibacteraceae bacterium]|nr:ABC transporter permease subunit [Acutalibacteraceae bacterium]